MARQPQRRAATRGASTNPSNRFERLALAPLEDGGEELDPRTQLLRDPSRSIVATNHSPDVGFDASVNPYRGCEHGCSYCYARPTHEYLGFSAGLDFETRILVKPDAPELLERALAAPGWKPRVVALSGVTDPYQPAERRLGITRRCLEVLLAHRNPVVLITKSSAVVRDLDLLQELARFDAVSVALSITSLDPGLQTRLEPRASHPRKRLAAIEQLTAAGVPVGVMVAPVIPGLTDHEIPAILEAAGRAGAGHAGFILLRLPHAVKQIFDDWLQRHVPGRRDKVLSRLRALHGGALYDARPGVRQRGTGPYARQIARLFEIARRRAGLPGSGPPLSTRHFRRDPTGTRQLGLFD